MSRLFVLPLLIITIFASCQQHAPNKGSLITQPTKDDKPVRNDSVLFKNCIVIGKSSYFVTYEEKTDTINDLEALTKYFQANQKQLNRSRLNILFDSSTAPRVIVDVLDLITDYKIDDYAVVNTQESKIALPSISIDTPSVLQEKDVDSSYFCIRITKSNFELSVLNKKVTARKAEDIEVFIKENAALIDRDKVVLIGKAELTYSDFKSVLEALSRYTIFRYSLLPL